VVPQPGPAALAVTQCTRWRAPHPAQGRRRRALVRRLSETWASSSGDAGEVPRLSRTVQSLPGLLGWVESEQAVTDLRAYFAPAATPGQVPAYSGSRFEFLAGGGDRVEVADRITAEDLVAVSTLSVNVPGAVALALLEGHLGQEISQLLAQVPTDVTIADPDALELFADPSPLQQAWTLLHAQDGMGYVITSKLLARKRPQLVPVYDDVVRCALGAPEGMWSWLARHFADADVALAQRLVAVRKQADVPAGVSVLRVLDVIVWMRHRPTHRRTGCADVMAAT
jgi:hypothetical protein